MIMQKFLKLSTKLSPWLLLRILVLYDMFDLFLPFVDRYYRKRPCISSTFFHKIEAKNQGCDLSMDTSVSEVLKNLINIHKTS